MSPNHLSQPVDRAPVGAARDAHVADRGGENLRALGIERFVDAIHRAVLSNTTHATLIVAADDDEFRAVCSCGWFGLTHVTREYAHADVCPFLEAEADLSRRARDLAEVTIELRALAHGVGR